MTEFQFDESGMLIPNASAAPAPTGEAQGETPAAPSIDVEAQTEEGQGILDTIGTIATEAGLAIAGGVAGGAEELGETIQWAGEGIGNYITGGKDLYVADGWDPEWITPEEAAQRSDIPEWQKTDLLGDGGLIDLPDVKENETVVGGMARGITQFTVGYLTLGRQLKIGKGIIGAATGGAVADFATFDAHEDRLSDFLRDNVGLQDPVTAYLSADEDDSILEGKLKNAMEGAALGIPLDGVLRLFKHWKIAKKVQLEQGDEAAAKYMNDSVEELAGSGQLDLFDETTDPNLRKADAAPDKVVRTGKNAADNSSSNPTATTGATGTRAGKGDTPVKPAQPVNTSALTESLNREIALRNGGSHPDPSRAPDGNLFNFDTMDADVEIKDVLNMASDAVDKSLLPQATSLDDVVGEARSYLAESIDVDPNVIDASLAKMAGNADKQRSMVVAGKVLVQSLAAEVERIAYVIDSGGATKETYEKFIRMQARLVETSGNLKATITGAAQATSAGRVRTSDWLTGQELAHADILKQIDDNIADAGGQVRLDDLARAVIANKNAKGGAGGVFKVAEGSITPMRVVNEVFINSILSGPKTQMANIIGNMITTAVLPGEKLLGAAMSRNPALMREGARQYAEVVFALKDSLRLAGVAFKRGRNMIDPEAAILEANGNDFHAIRSSSKNPVVRGLINGLGTVIRLPSRGLLSGDEFFKQLNYRSSLAAELHTEALDMIKNGQLTKDQATKYVTDRMHTAFARDGSAKSQRHLAFAREATYTQELRKGSASRSVQNFTNKHPAAKLIMPFVRTPMNLLKASLQRTPVLRRLSHTLDADIKSGDPRRVAAARGKLATGGMLWGSAIMLAQEGKITGSGPKDPQKRKRLMETGWRPNSLVVTDADGGKRYIEYRRIEPFSMFFGIAADVADIGGQMDEVGLGDLAIAAVVGLANNITSKTYLTGLSDAIQALNDPERYGQQLINRYTSSMIPMSGALREIRKHQDPALRDVRSITDAVMNTIPGYSDNLSAKRSWVTGEIIHYPKGWGSDMVSPLGEAFASMNPIIDSEWKQDNVLDELARLDFAFSAPTRKMREVELTEPQYERLLEIHGTVRIGRTTMYERLGKLFESARYQGFPRQVSDPTQDPRIMSVQKVITGYRRRASDQLMVEFPEIKSEIKANAQSLAENARSRYSGIADFGTQ